VSTNSGYGNGLNEATLAYLLALIHLRITLIGKIRLDIAFIMSAIMIKKIAANAAELLLRG
jgi:hypothetical protein